jgi:hypothetical protein
MGRNKKKTYERRVAIAPVINPIPPARVVIELLYVISERTPLPFYAIMMK